jgi:hypothetical protein
MNGLSKRQGRETSLHINLLSNLPNDLKPLNSKHLELNKLHKLTCHHETDFNGINDGRTRHLNHLSNPNRYHLSHLFDSNAANRINHTSNFQFPNKGIKMTLRPNYLRT